MAEPDLTYFITQNVPTGPYLKNAWCRFSNMSVYVRVSSTQLDVANITSDAPPKQGKLGVMLNAIGRILRAEGRGETLVVIENVLNKHIAASLTRRGWSKLDRGRYDVGSPPTFSMLAKDLQWL